MDKVVDVAAYIVKKYREVASEKLDEMKLHKLLYFTQRESFAVTGGPAFDGDLEGWKYGPVSRDVRTVYYDGEIVAQTKDISDGLQYIVNNVIYEYGAIASWKLSDISHHESSWLIARRGLRDDENGNRVLQLDDIKRDAMKVRPYDHIWDMYYDEFDTEDALV